MIFIRFVIEWLAFLWQTNQLAIYVHYELSDWLASRAHTIHTCYFLRPSLISMDDMATKCKDKTSFISCHMYKLLLVHRLVSIQDALQWRHDERDGVSYHRRPYCLLYCCFRRRSQKTSKLRVTGLCEGNSPVTGEFPAQKASNAENASIWLRHHGALITYIQRGKYYILTYWQLDHYKHIPICVMLRRSILLHSSPYKCDIYPVAAYISSGKEITVVIITMGHRSHIRFQSTLGGTPRGKDLLHPICQSHDNNLKFFIATTRLSCTTSQNNVPRKYW